MFRKTLELILGSYIQGRNAYIMCMALDLPDDPDSCVLQRQNPQKIAKFLLELANIPT